MTAAGTRIGREAYRDLSCYTVDQAPVALDLRDNTNLWGVPPAAARAIVAASTAICRYPRVYAAELRSGLADYVGVDPGMVVTGCGSDDVIDASLRALADPGDRVALLAPSFSTAATFARMNALVPVSHPITSDWNANVEHLLAADARVIYLCSPNNPTGTVVPRYAIERLIRDARGVVIIDEAYAEYAGESACDLVAGSGRLLLVRTLSKAFGLAGLRIGYGVAQPALIREVEKSRGPYKVNMVAERAALAALAADQDWIRDRVREAVTNRERLATALRRVGLPPLPSGANFLCCPTPRAARLARGLAVRGVGVRLFTGLATVGNALRMTVGPWPMMETLLGVLGEALAADECQGAEEIRCG